MAINNNKTIIKDDLKFKFSLFSIINLLIRLGKLETILVKISNDAPFPNPYSVII